MLCCLLTVATSVLMQLYKAALLPGSFCLLKPLRCLAVSAAVPILVCHHFPYCMLLPLLLAAFAGIILLIPNSCLNFLFCSHHHPSIHRWALLRKKPLPVLDIPGKMSNVSVNQLLQITCSLFDWYLLWHFFKNTNFFFHQTAKNASLCLIRVRTYFHWFQGFVMIRLCVYHYMCYILSWV